MDPDDYQDMANTPRPGDDAPTVITAKRAEKCAAILRAIAEGHRLYDDSWPDIVGYLTNAGYLARHPDDVDTRTRVGELARRLDTTPWPQIGPPRTQPH